MHDFLRIILVHFDFHASEHLTNIVGDFCAAVWAQLQTIAYLDSITCFAQGHHGMTFRDAPVHAERAHRT